jgi:uncharacterized protein
MTRARRLLELQAVDLKLDEHRTRLARVGLALQDDRALVAAREAVARTTAELATVDHSVRRAEQARESAQSHVAREESQLYSGKVKSPKEVQNLQREVEALRRQVSQLDDDLLEAMITRDEAAARAEAASAALSSAEATAEGQRSALRRRERELNEQIKRLEGERETIIATIAAGDLKQYERLRRSKGGRAVSELSDDACLACGMLLPGQDVNRIKGGDEHVLCPGCGRIVLG